MSKATTAPRQTRREQKEATRRQILDAAIDCFAHLGYDGTHFREITDRSGVQRALVLYHYQNKENLWRTAVEEVEQRFTEVFEQRCNPESQPDDRSKIRHTLDCYIDAMLEVPEYGQILIREGCVPGPRLDWLSRHFAPQRSLNLNLDDIKLENRIKKTIVRDILASTLVSFVTLAPLMDASLAVATRQTTSGIYPLNEKQKNEFINQLMLLIFSDNSEQP